MTKYPTYKLGEICTIVYGKGFPTKNLKQEGFPVYGANGVIGYNDVYLYEEEQVLISCRGAYSGRINRSPKKCWVTNNSLVIIPNTDVCKDYLYYALQSANKEKLVTGTAQPQVTINNANELHIPLPPLATQRAIVTRIETLFAELDKGVEKLKTAQQQLKVYRQAVLNDCLTKGSEKWENVKLGEVAEKIQIGPFGTQLHKSDYIEGGIPLINPMHISDRKIFPDNSFSVSTAKYKELENYYLSTNDVVLGRRGEMGRCAVVSENENGMLCGTGSLFIRGGKNLYAKYLCYLLSSQRIIAYFENSSSGTTMSNLNRGIVENTEIPLPSLSTQQRIVQEIETRLSACNEVEKNIAESLQQAEALRQSILKKAFGGELVSEPVVDIDIKNNNDEIC